MQNLNTSDSRDFFLDNFLGRKLKGRDQPNCFYDCLILYILYFPIWGYVKDRLYETPVLDIDEVLGSQVLRIV